MSKPVAVAYIPVLHKGYFSFLEELQAEEVHELYLIGEDILAAHDELDYINRKDQLRAVPAAAMKAAIESTTDLTVTVLSDAEATKLSPEHIVTPREDIGEVVVAAYFTEAEVEYRNVFVRRDKHAVGEDKVPQTEAVLPHSDFAQSVWGSVLKEAEKSADWYRRVGAALVKGDDVIFVTHNEHMPEEQEPNINGDARSLFKKGINIHYVTAAHAEVAAIGAAAKAGITTAGADMYVTDFPCPYCARLIAKAGIARVYFLKGYAVLDGDDFLKEAGVELIHVTLDT